MLFNESANNQVVKVRANDAFEIVLPEIRTAGYRWTLQAGAEPICRLLEETAQPNPGIGGTGKHSWKFRAASPGECEIELHYTRPWESSSEPAKTFRLKVQVRS